MFPVVSKGQAADERAAPQATVLRWLKVVAPSLAELYESARAIIDGPPLPARVRLVCHCMREVTNRLPECVSKVVVKGRADYGALTRGIEDRWKSVAPSGAVAAGNAAPEPAHVEIAFGAFVAIEALLAEHRAVDKRQIEKLQHMFGTYVSAESLPALQPTIIRFKEVHDWLVAHAHDNNRVDADMATWGDVLDRVRFVEDTLFALAAEWHRGQERIDDLVDEANRRTD